MQKLKLWERPPTLIDIHMKKEVMIKQCTNLDNDYILWTNDGDSSFFSAECEGKVEFGIWLSIYWRWLFFLQGAQGMSSLLYQTHRPACLRICVMFLGVPDMNLLQPTQPSVNFISRSSKFQAKTSKQSTKHHQTIIYGYLVFSLHKIY